MIKLAVFDWNGTLIADTPAVVEGVNREMAVIGRNPITIRDFREYYDTPTSHMFEGLGVSLAVFEKNRMAMSHAFHAYYEPRVARAHTRKGARQVLESLKKDGIRCILLSNHTM